MTSVSPLDHATHPRTRWLLGCTLLLLIGSAFRLIALQDVPPGLAQDEVLNADIVGFIRGGEHALFFRHGYGHEPLYHYWSVPFQVLLGDNFLSIRLPAAFLGLLLIALTLRWARRDFDRTVALVAGFGLAVSWWPTIFSRIGLRPIMEPVLLVAAVLLWPAGRAASSRRALPRAVAAGVVLGLTLYTYTAARVLFALPAAYAAYCLIQSWLAGRRVSTAANAPNYRRQALLALVALVVMAAVALPLFLTLQADPSLQQRVDQLSGPLDALRLGDWRPIAQTAAATLGFFGLTGDPRWTYMLPDTSLFEPLAAILFLAGLMICLARWRSPAHAFALIWLIVALVPSAVTPDAPSSVRLVGAMPVLYLLPGLAVAGVLTWSRGRWNALVAPLVGATLIVIGLLAVGRTVRDGFVTWPAALDTRLKYQSVLLDISRDPRLNQVAGQGEVGPVIADGFFEPIDDASLQRDLGRDVAARWVQSGPDRDGALVWPAAGDGDYDAGANVFVPEFAPLNPYLLAQAGATVEPLFRSEQRPSYGVYALGPPPASDGTDTTWAGASGPLLTLIGAAEAAGDDDAVMYTVWRVEDELPADLAIFIHLMDDAGQVVAQYDGLDAAAATLWPGDVVLQRHVVALPEQPPSGSLTLQVGLYRRSDDARLRTTDGRDAVMLAVCEFSKPENRPSGLVCKLPEPS